MHTKALVVDDSEITRRVVSLVLGAHRIESTEALNGEDALQILDRDPSYQLVLVDWNMPKMNGIEFIAAVRQQERFKHIKLIVVSARDTTEALAKARSCGADDFISKPISRDVVADKLQLHGLN